MGLEKLIMICHANPFWLFDETCDAEWAEYETGVAAAVEAPCVFAFPDVILKWIEAGKPQETDWVDGVYLSDLP